MRVKDVMSAELQGVRSDISLQEAAEHMRILDVGSLPVLSPEENRGVGMITDRDIVVRSVARGDDINDRKIGDIMSTPLVCCHEKDDLEEASAAIKAKRVRRVLVLNRKDQPMGIVSVGDLSRSSIDGSELTSVVRHVSAPTSQPR